jgi:GNAT superfamily N-acetyltransferase
MSKIRLLKLADLPQLLELSRQAGWNQTETDWARSITQSPDGCFGIEGPSGQVVSSITTIRYASELAWIGMVLTHKSHRGKGNATALMDHAIKHLRGARIRWIRLDATDEGRPLYAKLGFRDECPVERWKRPAGRGFEKQGDGQVHTYAVDPSFDRAYFGAYRVPLLNALARDGKAAFVVGYGYAMQRAGDKAAYFGPCVVRTRRAARLLLEWFLAEHPNEEVYWDLLPDNSDAVQLAIDYGFEPARHLRRMALAGVPDAPTLVQNSSSVFAIAGFEYG